MTTPLPVSPTPYITPATLVAAPSGISWSAIPAGNAVTSEARLAEQSNICARATALVDQACHQPLRATIDPLLLFGPGPRVGVDRGCMRPTSLIMKRWPVLEVISVQVAPNRMPLNWATVPATEYQIAYPVAGIYGSSAPASAGEGGQEIKVNPGWVRWDRGREGYAVLTQHVNGWPHAGITGTAAQDAMSLAVDDCAGWAVSSSFTGATGATGTVYDPGGQEVIQVTAASVVSGPGTLTLASPLRYGHDAGVIVSAMPQDIGWAAIMFAVGQALTRGATATTIHQIPGGPGGRSPGPGDWAKAACAMLSGYARII